MSDNATQSEELQETTLQDNIATEGHQELTDEQVVRASSQAFFAGYRNFQSNAKAKGVSKKDVIRAIGHAFNDGLTDIKVKLVSNNERIIARDLKDMIQGHLIMKAHQIEQMDKRDMDKLQQMHNEDVETKLNKIDETKVEETGE